MNTKLNLIKNLQTQQTKAKVVLPNFPFCYLLFKCHDSAQTYEVTDVSYSGMQLALRNGEHQTQRQKITGEIHWHGQSLHLEAVAKWKTASRMGVEFVEDEKIQQQVRYFFSAKQLAQNMRPIHQMDMPLEIPLKLKYWLRADGPGELFVWQYDNGELSKFQFLLLNDYIEWIDGQGLKSGRLFSKRDLKTPLLEEDEFTFMIDEQVNQQRLNFAIELLKELNPHKITPQVIEFLLLKLRH